MYYWYDSDVINIIIFVWLSEKEIGSAEEQPIRDKTIACTDYYPVIDS